MLPWQTLLAVACGFSAFNCLDGFEWVPNVLYALQACRQEFMGHGLQIVVCTCRLAVIW